MELNLSVNTDKLKMFSINAYKHGVTVNEQESNNFLVKKIRRKYDTPEICIITQSLTANAETILGSSGVARTSASQEALPTGSDVVLTWDFPELSKNPNLTWEIVQKYTNCPWDWVSLSKNPGITIDDIASHSNKPWNWITVSIYRGKCEDIQKYPDLPWRWDCIYRNLPTEFMRQFRNRLVWGEISGYGTFTLEQVREFQDNIDWDTFSGNYKITWDIVDEFSHKLNMDKLVKCELNRCNRPMNTHVTDKKSLRKYSLRNV